MYHQIDAKPTSVAAGCQPRLAHKRCQFRFGELLYPDKCVFLACNKIEDISNRLFGPDDVVSWRLAVPTFPLAATNTSRL